MSKLLTVPLWFVFLLFILAACSHSGNVEQTQGGLLESENKETTREEEEVSQQALKYLSAVQAKDYFEVYNMISDVHKEAGLTLEELSIDFSRSSIPFENFNPKVIAVRDRHPREIASDNIDDMFYLVSVMFESSGETREDYQAFDQSDVKWVDRRIWFHQESGEWKFYGTDDQEGITWKPDVYQAALTYIETVKDQQPDQIFSLLSDFYPAYGESASSIGNHIAYSGGSVKHYIIKEITDDLDLYHQYEDTITNNLVRVEIYYVKEDGEEFGVFPNAFHKTWYFHLENGAWKLLGLSKDDLGENIYICYLEETCMEYFTNPVDENVSEPFSSESGSGEAYQSDESAESYVSEAELAVANNDYTLYEDDFVFRGITLDMTVDEVAAVTGQRYDNVGESGVNIYAFDGFSLIQREGSESFTLSFMDETLTTVRGISIGSSLRNLIDKYGTNYEEEVFDDGYRYLHYRNLALGKEFVFGVSNGEVQQVNYSKLE
ncbi:hypothetical protein GCM10011351_29180 [Paraliobacillus quinghaiensis]|uniref:Lipoprotein n=1 Tax=Paraliobacillus quinghaiensis TaxID=470815 RepID=A0A917TWA9_9BACI|nr:hypothetical protein [Paraliobacillus quinghaiensis]GGM41152.1 hypothetical protein GCM10011351_29180 [Paraliobacillus quinghaiensis]